MSDLDIEIIEGKIARLLKRRSKINNDIMQLVTYRDILLRKKDSGLNDKIQTHTNGTEQITDEIVLAHASKINQPEQTVLPIWELKQPVGIYDAENISAQDVLSDEKACESAMIEITPNKQKDEVNPSINVNKNSPIEEKYALFLSLFAGRPDVHAKRYFSITKGTHGYSPVCNNLFNKALCPKGDSTKKQTKCIDCKNRDFPKISLDEFAAHIKGEKHDFSDVLGAYPMDADEMCSFIVADFDNEDRSGKSKRQANKNADNLRGIEGATPYETLKMEAVALLKTCVTNGIQAYLEISRSGKGFHIWIFFADKVPAWKARKLFDSAYTTAMNEYADLSFGSYDRFIPNQNNLPTYNGLGSLIALPLQGKAGKQGYSLFVDEELNHYPDQWQYLSNIKKMHSIEIDKILNELSLNDDLGDLTPNVDEDDHNANKRKEKPWEKRKAEVKLSIVDFKAEVEIVCANMIYIEKSKLSVQAINRLKRLGAYKNPEFYKAQAMRERTDDKPRIISTTHEESGYICLPRGALNEVKMLFDTAGAKYCISDKTATGRKLDVSFVGQLRDEQKPAADALLAHEIGVLSAAGGFGKTVIGIYLIAARALSTLVIVHTQEVFNQWKDALNKHLVIRNEPAVRHTAGGREKIIGVIGEYSGNKKHLSTLVDVAMTQSLSRAVEEKLFLKEDYGLVIIDECHRIPAATFEAVLKQVNAKFVYGLTATPYRNDKHHAILFLRCGPIRYKVDDRQQAEKRPFDHFVLPRFTELLPTSVHDTENFQQLVTDIGADTKRNDFIVEDILKSVKAGRNPLVLSERIEHVSNLVGLLSEKCDNVIKLTGGMKAEEKRSSESILSSIKEGDEFVIVATGSYAGEGFDFPRLDTLFLVTPISFKGKINQYTSRLHRLYEGKKDVIVYDYVDINIPVLERMYYKRIRGYKSVGYKTAAGSTVLSKSDGSTNIIYDSTDYVEVFGSDVETAEKEIVVSSPYLSSSRVALLIQKLSIKVIDNIIITVITKPSAEYVESKQKSAEINIKRLLDSGIKVAEYSDLHQIYAVIDQRVVWYGSINLLGASGNNDNAMRLDSPDIAMAILKQHHEIKSVSRDSEQLSLFSRGW
jgi:superfamily II DNA or RNA helicase